MNTTLPDKPDRRFRLGPVAVLLLAVSLATVVGYLTLRQVWAWRRYEEASAALTRQDWAAAAEQLDRCLEVWPHDRTALPLAARTARRADRLQEAHRLQGLWASRLGDSPELALERTLLIAQQGQRPEVERVLGGLVADHHLDAALILEALTQGAVRTLRVPQAHQHADALLRLQPDHAQAWAWRAWARERFNRNEEALDDYARAVELRPGDAATRLSFGLLLLDFLRYPEALEQFRWLRRQQPDNAEVALGLARCLRGVGAADEARQLLDELVAAFPEEGLILSERGRLVLEEGQSEEAERWLRRAAELAPYDRLTHFALYTCLRQSGQHPEEADEHLRQFEQLNADQKRLRALEAHLSQPGATAQQHCEAGQLCFRLGRPDQGERHLLAALRADPGNREAHRSLAEYYLRTNRADLASAHRSAAR